MNEQRYFQWIAGDRRGEILLLDNIVEEDGIVYLSFKDDSRINEEFVAQLNQRDLTNKLMAEIDSPQNCWKFNEKVSHEDKPRIEKDDKTGICYEIPSVEEMVNADLSGQTGQTRPNPKAKKTIELIPPALTAPTHSAFGRIERAKQSPISPEPQVTVEIKEEDSLVKEKEIENAPMHHNNDSDPVYILMSKAKKIDTEICMEMTISLPLPALYQIAKDSFENGDEKFIDYIVDEIKVDEIKNALKNAIFSMYENENSGNAHIQP